MDREKKRFWFLPWLAVAILSMVGGILLLVRRQPPNVLLITIDTLRADHLGCYGYKPAVTPEIDRLAAEGVRVETAVTSAPVTLPAHATILTSLYPPVHGIRDNGVFYLDSRVDTLAERLQKRGYDTGAFVSAVVLNRRYGLDQGFSVYDDEMWGEEDPKLFMIRERSGPKTVGKLVDWLQQYRREKRRRPWFAWIHLFEPHQPYTPPLWARFSTPLAYDGEIAAADRALAPLFEDLRRSGELDRTLTVLTADHGEGLGEHHEKTHAVFIYQATVRVPLIFRYPRLFPAGAHYRKPVRTADIMPTILAACGIRNFSSVQGINLLPALRGEIPPPKLDLYTESRVSELGFGMAPLFGIISGGYKYIRAPRLELYDLEADPGELHNRYATETGRAMALEQLLRKRLADPLVGRYRHLGYEMEKETLEVLRSLGYLASPTERRGMGAIDPKDGILIYEKLEEARHQAQRDEWPAAEKLLREILEQVPGHVSARNILALALFRQGRSEEARVEYLRSLEADPQQARVWLMLGQMDLMLGDIDRAERQLQQALAVHPGFVEAMSHLGMIENLRGRTAAAEEWFRRTMAADPAFPPVYRRLGDLYFERADWPKALDLYRKARERNPADFRSGIQEGNCLKRLGETEAAQSAYAEAARINSESWIPHYNLACLAALDGRHRDAVKHLETAIAKGFQSREIAENDPDFTSLRLDPDFARLVQKLPGGDS